MFFAYKKLHTELRRELVKGCTVSRYEQLETSPETIEQQLRPTVCEHRLFADDCVLYREIKNEIV